MAGLTHADEGLTFEQAYDLLGGLDPADLHEWEEDLFEQTGQRLRFATRDVSVVDTPEDGACFRSLHFNDRFDVVQTCIALDAATGGPDHSRPPSLDSQAGTATQGLSLAVALHQISSSRGAGGDAAGGEAAGGDAVGGGTAGGEAAGGDAVGGDAAGGGAAGGGATGGSTAGGDAVGDGVAGGDAAVGGAAGAGRRIAVLGAGACALPAFLHEALPGATIDAVELSGDVCAAARACFGVAALEGSPRFALHEACAFDWLAAAKPCSLDLIIVDMEVSGLELWAWAVGCGLWAVGLGLGLAWAWA